jgi:putative ABC transport system permease protein
MARLKQGMTVEEAQSRAQQFSAEMARKYPQSNADWHVRVVTVREDTAGNLRPAMTVLLGALACILLIMCANIANLLLGRLRRAPRNSRFDRPWGRVAGA